MGKANAPDPANKPPVVRCAIYTRKSTEEGLEQEFNSLDAQRESAEAFVKSQAHEGWTCVPDRYDDGGFTGGNLDRPALKRLLTDVGAGQVDAVVVYKVDRLSRSLLDFARLMESFEAHQVSFVSVTQQFNSATSMGRLVLNVLLSFAQFEREIISERTRDKIAATRRKGKWAGGAPLLGYDVDPRGGKLVVNDAEAERVRAIFALYLEHQALLPVVQELGRRGWTTKRWVNKAGRQRGKVRYKHEVHEGEQPALVDAATWQGVQRLLQAKGHPGGGPGRGTRGFLLQGLLRCAACACAMTPSHSRRGTRRYRYYVCTRAQKRGWDQCASKSVPAAQIEAFVLEQIRCLGRDPAWLAQAAAEVGLHEAETEGRADGAEVALEALDSAWPTLTTEQQARVLDLLVQRVAYDGGKETVSITFRADGLRALAGELAAHTTGRTA